MDREDRENKKRSLREGNERFFVRVIKNGSYRSAYSLLAMKLGQVLATWGNSQWPRIWASG